MFAARRARRLQVLLQDHGHAVQEFVDRARALSRSQWVTPRGDGKWTPAQETRHVILAYEAFLRELNGGTSMRLRGNVVSRRVWRLFGLTSILWRKRIPVAVRAPREVRPEAVTQGPDQLLPELQRRAREFDELFATLWRTTPKRKVTHPFFGKLSLDHGIRFACVHIRHHAAFLPPPTQGIRS